VKITWFGGSTFRIQIGGQVVVVDPQGAPDGIDRSELVSGADQVTALGSAPMVADMSGWRPRPAERLLDAGDRLRPVEIWSLGPRCLLVDGDDDMPLLLAGDVSPPLGRWAERGVIVLCGTDLAARAGALLAPRAPKLVALAGDDAEIGAAFNALPALLDGTGLVALEAGLAVEV
jgi:hypothetical protein